MAELTREDFERILTQRLELTESKIIARIDESQEELARIIARSVVEPMTRRFDYLEKKLDVSERVQQLEQKLERLADALHVKL